MFFGSAFDPERLNMIFLVDHIQNEEHNDLRKFLDVDDFKDWTVENTSAWTESILKFYKGNVYKLCQLALDHLGLAKDVFVLQDVHDYRVWHISFNFPIGFPVANRESLARFFSNSELDQKWAKIESIFRPYHSCYLYKD